eukprot:scaffold226563_cov24-Attheya_sp.AAC.1
MGIRFADVFAREEVVSVYVQWLGTFTRGVGVTISGKRKYRYNVTLNWSLLRRWSCLRQVESNIACGAKECRAEEKWIASSEGVKRWKQSIIEGMPGTRRNLRIEERDILHTIS